MPAMADLATGAALYTKKDYEHAFTELLPTAKDGDVVAQFIVGVMYDLGQYVAVDKQVAAGWYKQAADQGYPEAQIRLAGMLRAGEGMSPDREAAYKWALLATDRLPVKKQDGARAVAASIRSFLTDEQATRVQAEVAAWRPMMPAIPRRDGAAPHLVKAGTGVFLNEQGALLTDLHVVSACPRLLVSYGNATNEATIRTFDAPLDIAVLETPFRRVEAAVFAVLPVGSKRECYRLCAAGNPLPHASIGGGQRQRARGWIRKRVFLPDLGGRHARAERWPGDRKARSGHRPDQRDRRSAGR